MEAEVHLSGEDQKKFDFELQVGIILYLEIFVRRNISNDFTQVL